MPNPPVKILTSFQIELLKAVGSSSLGHSFFLTGGTALAAHYLYHRLSEDLDLFTEQEKAVDRVAPALEELAAKHTWALRFSRRLPTFLEVFVTSPEGGDPVKMQFAQDSPYRFEPVVDSPWCIKVDNPLDISCNKLAALFGHAEARDFVDVFFIVRDLFSFEKLTEKAKQKNPGLDDYWLAQAYQQVLRIGNWPRMLVPLDRDEMNRFFLERARMLLDRLKKST